MPRSNASAPLSKPSRSDCSGWHETAPVGGPANQGPFLNAAVRLETTASAEQLHLALRQIELDLGRRRVERWEARAIDLDLLLYADQVIETPQLVVPHPRMAFRRFVLEAAVEVAPEMVHPTIGWTVGRLLEHLDSAAEYVALLGLPGSGKTALAASLAQTFDGRLLLHGLAPTTAKTPDSRPQDTVDPPSHAFRATDTIPRPLLQLAGRGPTGPGQSNWRSAIFTWINAWHTLDSNWTKTSKRRLPQAWQEAGQRVVLPKLLIVLDSPPPGQSQPPEQQFTAVDSDSPPTERLRQELLRLASRQGLGPVLFTGGTDQRTQYEEISAAITSMQ